MSDRTEQRLHPAWIVLRAVATLRAMALPLVIFLFSRRDRQDLFGFGVAGLFILGTVVVRALSWLRFTYAVTPQGVQVRSGLLTRRERLVPFERIQSVDLREGLLERLFGVTQVRIETAAGGGNADVILGAISREQATELRDLLRRRSSSRPGEPSEGHAPSVAASVAGEPIYTVSPGRLLIAGATSNRIGPALAILAGAFQFADDLLPKEWWERLAMSAPTQSLRVLVALVLVALAVAWIIAIATTVLTFGGFELRREGDRLLISYGLLERRRSTIPIARIQAVTISESWLRQPFGLAAVRVESAGYGKASAESGVLAPIIPIAEVATLLDRACPAYSLEAVPPRLQPLPSRARRRYVLSRTWVVLGVAALSTMLTIVLPWSSWWWGTLILALLPPSAAFGLLQHRDAGWALHASDRFVMRTRDVDRVTAITLRSRLQERSISQQPLQRRADLASFHTAVASGGSGGRFGLIHLDASVASDLVDRLGPRPAGRSSPPRPGVTLTTVGHDDDDSSVEFRTSLLPDRHDGSEDIAQRAPGSRPTDVVRAAPPLCQVTP
jgi:putative membrane protein